MSINQVLTAGVPKHSRHCSTGLIKPAFPSLFSFLAWERSTQRELAKQVDELIASREKANGSIEVQSTVGLGSQFAVKVPLKLI